MKSTFLGICVTAFFFAVLPSQAQTQATPSETESKQATARGEIENVIEQFRTSIIDRDKARFLGLFLKDSPVVWQNVTGDANLQERRRKKPDAQKVRVDPSRGPTSFIDGIVSDSRRSEETFDNIRIETDGDVASVFFDYRFLSDGRETNHGKEAWHLVRNDDGWKIVSVIWSVNWQIRQPG